MKPAQSICASCPWRVQNLGKPHPHGWYKKSNLRRLWNGLRRGVAPGMTCHSTDDNVERPPCSKPVPHGVEVQECAGAMLLICRELRTFEATPGDGQSKIDSYRKGNPNGFTLAGLRYWVQRAIFGGTPLVRGIPDIDDDPTIQHL